VYFQRHDPKRLEFHEVMRETNSNPRRWRSSCAGDRTSAELIEQWEAQLAKISRSVGFKAQAIGDREETVEVRRPVKRPVREGRPIDRDGDSAERCDEERGKSG
jgi:hypothetical protein